MIIECDFCNKTVNKPPSLVNSRKNTFCSRECANSFKRGKSNFKIKTKVNIKCYLETCMKEFERQPYRLKKAKRHFCSRECQFKWQKSEEYSAIRPKKVKIKINCSYCNKDVYKKKFELGKKYNFCNASCRNKFLSQNQHNPNPTKPQLEVHCKECGDKKFIPESVFKKNKHGFFCSYNCYWKWKSENLNGDINPLYNRVNKKCNNCTKEIIVLPSNVLKRKHHFCSKECYWEFRSEYYCGERHPSYGTTVSEERKESSRKRMLKMYKDGVFNRQTSIQKKVNNILKEINIIYKNEFLFKYYSVDNFIQQHNLIIEVMGDYWHSSPIKYKEKKLLNKTQLDMIRRDKSKLSYLKKHHSINPLYLWEKDINSNIILCKKLIVEYINNNGYLMNFNSFNYHLNKQGEIVLNNQQTLTYFEK